jgi:hypothetical protein
MRDTFDWDKYDHKEDYDVNDQYEREKHAHSGNSIDDEKYQEELMGITYHVRRDLQCKRINVFVNKDSQIVLSSTLRETETMLTVMEIFEEMNRLIDTYLSDFDISNFEMVMEEDKPTIYCSYERI